MHKNLDNAMKQLIEWKILEYVKASDSYQVTEAFHKFIKKMYDKWTADPDSFPFKEEGNSNDSDGSIYDFFAHLIEQYIGVDVLAGKDKEDRTAILAVFTSLVQELDLKTHDERYEN